MEVANDGCYHVTINITLTFESTFFQSCLPPEESAREWLLAEDPACDWIAPAWCGKTGEWYHRALWKTGYRWTSLLPLKCWQGPEDDNKGVSVFRWLCCLTPIYRRERRFFDIRIPGMRLRNNSSNVGPASLLQILVVQGDGEGEKGDRKDRK